MLNKLLSNLPFNPSLINQVLFYGQRLKKEDSIRRLGFIFASLALVIQVFAVISPPQPSLASSSNDLVDGGVSSAQDAANNCKSNTDHYGDILAYYDISCNKVASASTVSLNSRDYNSRLYSVGHLNYPLPGETPVAMSSGTVYWRYLWGWDTGSSSTYKALKITNGVGTTYFILYSCGNLVSVDLPRPPAKCIWNPSIFAGNASCQPPRCSYDSSLLASSAECGPCPYNHSIDIASPSCKAPSSPPVITTPSTPSTPTTTASAPTCALDSSILASDSQCVSCPYKSSILQSNSECVPCQYPQWGPITADNPSCQAPCQYNNGITASNPLCIPPCPYDGTTSSNSPSCKPCAASQSQSDKLSCLALSKTASNLTQNISNADGTTAHAGDVIQYTLNVQNEGKATVSGFVIQEDISDVMDYANPDNLNGGTLSSSDLLSWAAQDIGPGQTVSKQFTMQVKNPIPQTPPSSSDPGHFDMIMTNIYGNAINIKLPQTIVQASEQIVATSLPNTGPGSSLIVGFIATTIIGYFFARGRILAKEINIVRSDFTSGEL